MPPQHTRRALLVFTRFPEAGTTKTRLIPTLGAQGAAALQRQMAEHIVGVATAFCKRDELTLEIHFQGGDNQDMAQWLGPHTFKRQAAGSIGERMQQGLAQAFARGLGPVVLIGSDCPELSTGLLRQAFLALTVHDLVLGPAFDGGYYLIGLNEPRPWLFDDIDWGTASVLAQTLAKAHSLNVSQLTTLHDIDRPSDLAHLHHHSHPQ